MPPSPPQNGGYLMAAYLVAAVIMLGYALSLWRRIRRELHDRTER